MYCQSCAMPMKKDEDFGTEADGLKNQEYCCFCYQRGAFTNPDLSMEEMVEKLAAFHDQFDMSQKEASKQAQRILPELKRWKN